MWFPHHFDLTSLPFLCWEAKYDNAEIKGFVVVEGLLGRRCFFKTSMLGFAQTEQQVEHLPLLLAVLTSSNI